MRKIISMLLIGLMLAGCGAQDKQLRLQHINEQKTITSIKEEMAQMRAERTQGWWNWKLDEKGWGSWITTKTIAITTTAVAVGASLGYLFYRTGQIADDLDDVGRTASNAWNRVTTHETKTSTKAHPAPKKSVAGTPGGSDKPLGDKPT